jgi:GrpB-like predicted nucleotidyltransferase (UPF0157 family)
MSDAGDRQLAVGDPAFDRFEIVEPRFDWADSFAAAAAEICGAPVEGIRRIDHIGSTSVANLAGKDRIDIQATVDDLDLARAASPALAKLGFVYEPALSADHTPTDDEHGSQKLSLHRSHTRPWVTLHVREWRRANWVYAILFRDYLRATPFASNAYSDTKRRLAVIADGQRSPYSFVKEPVATSSSRPQSLGRRRPDGTADTTTSGTRASTSRLQPRLSDEPRKRGWNSSSQRVPGSFNRKRSAPGTSSTKSCFAGLEWSAAV